jgi:Tfp pilus assembly protein PilE
MEWLNDKWGNVIMRVDMTKTSSSNSQGGFSLIELAMIMIIMGVLTVPLLQRYQVYKEEELRDKTSIAFSSVNEAIGAFYMENGYYPCPADRSIPFNDPDHGESVENCTTEVPLGSCSANNGICHGGGGGGSVLGGVPYATLNIPYTDAIDGYDNYMNYVVSDTYANAGTAWDETRVGTLTLEVNIMGSSEIQNQLLYGLISQGANHKGAFNTYGREILACTAGTADFQNCNNDSTFIRADRSERDDNNYFDDVVSFNVDAEEPLWKLNEATANIFNTNAGSIGIGTKTPDPTVKVDVTGDIRAQNFRANQYCDEEGGYCTQTDVIAGDRTRCPAGQYLVGIANNEEICAAMSVNVTPSTCPPGQFVTGISGNSIQCAAPVTP